MTLPNGEPLKPVPDPVIVERTAINPLKVATACAVFLASLGVLISGTSPINLEDSLSTLAQYVFASLGMISATSVLAGVYWTDRRDGLLIEIPGLMGMGGILVTYGASIYTITPPAAILSSFAAPLTIALGFGCAFRVWQVIREIQRTAKDGRRLRRAQGVSELLDQQEGNAEE